MRPYSSRCLRRSLLSASVSSNSVVFTLTLSLHVFFSSREREQGGLWGCWRRVTHMTGDWYYSRISLFPPQNIMDIMEESHGWFKHTWFHTFLERENNHCLTIQQAKHNVRKKIMTPQSIAGEKTCACTPAFCIRREIKLNSKLTMNKFPAHFTSFKNTNDCSQVAV